MLEKFLDPWVDIGLFGQGLFFMRFLCQWLYSERMGRSAIPDVFWYFSLGGGLVLLTYAVAQRDPVFTLGQGMGLIIYIRNLWLIRRERRRSPATTAGLARP